eukprot:586159-Pleurochrysis_carterae.AAC.1
MGRGAILAGAEVIGFDIARRPFTYEFKARDVMDDQFWAEMNNLGRIKGHPAPDIIHAIPPCNEFSALRRLGMLRPIRLSGVEA